jgi:hypothetical protein
VKAILAVCVAVLSACGSDAIDRSATVATERIPVPSTEASGTDVSTTAAAANTSSSPPTTAHERAGCQWSLTHTADGGAMGNFARTYELRNSGDAPCPQPGLLSVEGRSSDGTTVEAELGQTYFAMSTPPGEISPDSVVRIVIVTNSACEVEPSLPQSARLDELSIALIDGTTFGFPLENEIDPSCGFRADLGVP